MKHENLKRFLFEKNEIWKLLIKEIEKQGLTIEGETKVTLHPLAITIDLYKKMLNPEYYQ